MISDHRCTHHPVLELDKFSGFEDRISGGPRSWWTQWEWLRADPRFKSQPTERGSDEKPQAQRSPNAKLDQHLTQFPTIKRMLGAVFLNEKTHWPLASGPAPPNANRPQITTVIYYCLFVCFPACLLYLSISAGISTV